MSDEGKRYSDTEIQRIIKRALALQHQEQDRQSNSLSPKREGFTLSDIESIAGDTGIDSEYIRQAARELDLKMRERMGIQRFLGASYTPSTSRHLDREVKEDELKDIMIGLQSIIGEYGMGNVHKSFLTWSTSGESAQRTGRMTTVDIQSRNGKTHITVGEKLGNMAGGIFGGLMGGVGLGAGMGIGFGVGLGSLASPLFAAAFPVATIAGMYLLSRTIFRGIVRGRRKAIEEIADKIANSLEA